MITDLTAAISASWSPKTLEQWLDWYDLWVSQLVVPRPEDSREHERVLNALNTVRAAVDVATEPLTVADFLIILDEAFNSIGSVASVLTGGVTITSPETMSPLPMTREVVFVSWSCRRKSGSR